MTELVGQTHTKLLQWLHQDWIQEGPPICFLEGFPGVGKSSLAYALMEQVEGLEAVRGHGNWKAVKVDMPEGGANAANDLLLRLSQELSLKGHNKIADAVKEGKSLEEALNVVLRRYILIVVDEFQRALLPETGQPIQTLEQIFQRIANRPKIRGRLLLLTNRLIEPDARWSEPYAVKRLPALEILEAEQLLGRHLREKDREQDVPIKRRRDVVNWLGRNPRAMEVLVASLENESLDDLIGISPESWELKDREVSEYFVSRLEERLLKRTLKYLSPEIMLFLKQLAVYRKPFQRKAMESFLERPKNKKEFSTKSAGLTNRFLLERLGRLYSLHPVARAIVLQQLKEEPDLWKAAHSQAADFYMKPFSKPNIEGSKLGGSFLESRYHLVQSEREQELGQIAQNFEQYLKATTQNKRSIPKKREELNENILVFSVLAKAIYSEELECYLVWLFQARRQEGDLEQALYHAKQATGLGLQVTSWLLRVELELQLRDPQTALETCQQGISQVSVDEEVELLYNRCTELLQLCDRFRLDDAIKLLEDGIQKIPSGLGLTALYQQGATLLTQAKEREEAVIWLKQGIRQVSPEHNLVKLYQDCAELLCQIDRVDEAVSLLEEGIERVSPEYGLNQLYHCCSNLLVKAERLPEAVNLLKEGIHNIPPKYDPFVLYERCTELLIQSGNGSKAVELLQDSFRRLPSAENQVPFYERWGNLLARTGQQEEAIALLKHGIDTIPAIRGTVPLYLACGKFLADSGQVRAAATLLEQGIQRVPIDYSHSILWENCADLLEQLGEIEQATDILKDGIQTINHHRGRYQLYRHCAELLERSDKIDEAADLLREGISVIAHDDSRNQLYLACGILLKRHNRIDEAITLLRQGIVRIPSEYNVQNLYTSCSNLLSQANRTDEAITLLRQGIDLILPEHNVESLYTSCSNLLSQANRTDEAITLLRQGIDLILPEHNVQNLYTSCSNLLAQANRTDEAITLLCQGIDLILPEHNVRTLYTSCSNLLAQANRTDEA
ncbi:MAG: hypothetical protein F6J92_31190, partial [Symploca sp. SIO1A3]|nr:hypothetical protein [Symploca sp. SIO1A3]